jgi:CRISPR-associated endonuclease/helicase Cas3
MRLLFEEFFRGLTNHQPHGWQARLASDTVCRDQLVRIPTGFGKTAGVTVSWLWNRVHRKDDSWPRRLIFCLPMRTLVEQTQREVANWFERAGLEPRRHVHTLIGGLSPSEWHLEPARECALIGTQDMLLSRALNRGYGSARARWPMEYGLLNVDCLWVMDEIQLMGVGLATSAQLQAFARCDEDHGKLPRPRRTWWMSATLQSDWLRRAPALRDIVQSLPIVRLEQHERTGDLWAVEKSIGLRLVPAVEDRNAEAWADVVAEVHGETKRGITLAVANTVGSAVALYKGLKRQFASVDLRLVHSRFRGEERRGWTTEFLAREHCASGNNRVIVATQVVEAGVDVSADVLVTEIAPWASLVQRFGRCARYGGQGRIIVIDRRHSEESARSIKAKDETERADKRFSEDRFTVLPYEPGEIEAATEAIALLSGAGPAALHAFEEAQAERGEESVLPRLYPYAPLHVLTQRELHDLFDTTPDLTGADIDVSRFVREGEDRDVTIWWWPVPTAPHERLRPSHDALCRIPVGEARRWLLGTGSGRDDAGPTAPGEAKSGSKRLPRAWVWSYLDRDWERVDERHIYPGQTILVDARAGGYHTDVGFVEKAHTVVPVREEHARAMGPADAADAADEQDELSEGIGDADRQYKTVATHCAEVARELENIFSDLGVDETCQGLERRALLLAGCVHDIGKAHPAFRAAIRDRNGIAVEVPLAKAPRGRWHRLNNLYDNSVLGKRPGFRHELASALALMEMAWRARPDHPGLQGGHEDALQATVGQELPGDDRIAQPTGFVSRVLELDQTTFNLVLYLVMSHHGKVRATLAMSPRDQDNAGLDGALPIRGIRDGDVLPLIVLGSPGGSDFQLPEVTLRLEPARLGLSRRYGPSWVERVLALRDRYGSFQLAWLEALLRVADVRASQIAVPLDPRLPPGLAEVPTMPEASNKEADLRKWIEETLAATDVQSDADSRLRQSAHSRAPKSAGARRRRGNDAPHA